MQPGLAPPPPTIPYLLLRKVSEGYSARHEDGGRLRDPEDLPAEVLEEGGEPSLSCRLPTTWTARQNQLKLNYFFFVVSGSWIIHFDKTCILGFVPLYTLYR